MKRKILFGTVLLVSTLVVGCSNASSTDTESTQTQSEQASSEPTSAPEEEATQETESQNNEVEKVDRVIQYKYDLTHDGKEDEITIKIKVESETSSEILMSVTDGDKIVFEEELMLHPVHGVEYYLVSYENSYYLMYYNNLVDHDEVTVSYEVFSLENGEQKELASDAMELSLFDIDKLDKADWIAFAEQENKYFENAFLLISTQNAELNYSDGDEKVQYVENYKWTLPSDEDKYATIEEILDEFIKRTTDTYIKGV